ncbi:c-type cytochrome [Sulfuricystis multivorans]|uniref:c-type cytochrome n=1 Tax=Sulfuricystis multivorans TaxID=2211108 RepID=UPI000F84B98F|nr:c-type cytochrome [Sulfuricystis multivorans]
MKQIKLIASALIAAGVVVSAPAFASAGLDLAKKSNCMSCHMVDKKLVGPAYQDVAKKYAGQKDAEAKLFEKVKKGGKGVWGEVPMPPNSAVKDEDIKTLVKWVLDGAK